jgi:hypothetical protein
LAPFWRRFAGKKAANCLVPQSNALGMKANNVDINTSKNLAFSLFTFAPVIVIAILTCLLLMTFTFINKKKVKYQVVTKACGKAVFYQIAFLFVVLGFCYVLFLAGTIKFIPLILVLPISTIVSFVCFVVVLVKKKSEIYV